MALFRKFQFHVRPVTSLIASLRLSTVSRAMYVYMYRGGNKGLFVLLSNTQAGPGRTVKQEQEEISRNHVQTFISPSVYVLSWAIRWALGCVTYIVTL